MRSLQRALQGLFGYLLGGTALFLPPTMAADKSETWVEVRSPHFLVASNAGEKQARRVADQFEQIRATFQKSLNNIRVDPGKPIVVLAAKNEASLKALLPEFWEKKGQTHPAGIFVPGQGKHYVALRTDTAGDNPYHVIYHEYVHLLTSLNFRRLPVWLSEGYAEFLGNTMIGEKELKMGRPSRSHVLLLRESKLLPLEVLLKVDHNSPHYNEANKTSVFYAQSWALVHYLMLDEEMRKTKPLDKFLQLVRDDVEEAEAARRAFGNLKQLERKIESYVRQEIFYEYTLKAPAEVTDKDLVARSLSAAESAAVRGDFHVYRQRWTEARALLEEALLLDPQLASAHESMGELQMQIGNREEAAKHFAQAVQLDSRSYLAHFAHAMLMFQGTAQPDTLAAAEASLRRAIELNPAFAPAHATLASLYTLRKETLDKAMAAARKAVELEPGEIHYYLNLGHVLLRMERVYDARVIGQQALAAAKSPDVRAAAESLLNQLASFQEYAAQRKRYEEESRAAREQLQAIARTEEEAKPPASAETPVANTQPAPPAAAAGATGRRYSMFGRITQVNCAKSPEMELTLSMGGIVMRLRAASFFKVDYLTTSWNPPANFNPCAHLKGLSAEITYTLAQGQPHDGEIISVEVKK